MRKLLTGLSVLLATGCAHMVPLDANALDFYLTRKYHAGRELCFDATVKTLRDMNTPIAKRDRASGTIVTERARFNEYAYGNAALPNS